MDDPWFNTWQEILLFKTSYQLWGLPSLLFSGYEGGCFLGGGNGQRDHALCLMPYMPLWHAQGQLYLFYVIFTSLDILKVYLRRNFHLTLIYCYTETVGTP